MNGEGDYIKQKGKGHLAIQNSEINITYSIHDRMAQLKREGDYDGIAELLKQTLDMAGTVHPYYPYYRFKPVQFGHHTVLEHEPLSEEANEKYPLTYRGRFKVPLGGHSDFNDLIQEAYINQDKIEIDMSSFSAWLGENEVPTPNLEDITKEGKWYIVPEPLPKPMQLKLYIKGEPEVSIIDYLELNIRDIDRENELVMLDNRRQKQSKLLVTLKLHINDTSVKIDVKIKDEFQNHIAANRDLLLFIKRIKENQSAIAFKNLQSETDFIVAPNFNFNGDLENIEKDYKVIDRLFKIESFFDITFTLPDKFDNEDWEAIEILESIMQEKPIRNGMKNLSITMADKEGLKNMIDMFDSYDNTIPGLRVTSTGEDGRIKLFGAVIPLEKVHTTYKRLKIENLMKAKRKYRDFEEGEQIKITFLPVGDDNEYEQEYFVRKKT